MIFCDYEFTQDKLDFIYTDEICYLVDKESKPVGDDDDNNSEYLATAIVWC